MCRIAIICFWLGGIKMSGLAGLKNNVYLIVGLKVGVTGDRKHTDTATLNFIHIIHWQCDLALS